MKPQSSSTKPSSPHGVPVFTFTSFKQQEGDFSSVTKNKVCGGFNGAYEEAGRVQSLQNWHSLWSRKVNQLAFTASFW